MSKTKLTINNNGSPKSKVISEIVDGNGNVYGLEGRTVLGLCRCGLSANKPFAMVLIEISLTMIVKRLIYPNES
jgi:hypothetical protein